MERSDNQTKLRDALPGAGDPPATPADLAAATGLGYSTVTRLLRELARAGLAVKGATGWQASGNPSTGPFDPDRADDVAALTNDNAAADQAPSPGPDGDAGWDPGSPDAGHGPAVTGDRQDATGLDVNPPDDRPAATASGAKADQPGDYPPDPDTDTTDAVSPVAAAATVREPSRHRMRKGELREQVLAVLRAHRGEELGPHQLSKLLAGKSQGAIANACDRLVGDGHAQLTSDKPRRYTATPVN